MAISPISDAIKAGLASLGSADQQAASSGAIFIGVGKGSETETRLSGLSQTYSLASRFGAHVPFAGTPGFQAYKTGSELDQLTGFSPDDVFSLQKRLYDAGMLDDFIPGSVDSATRNAFKELLGIANASGRRWTDTLDQIGAVGGRIKKGEKKQNPPLTISLSNPDDIRAVLHNAAMQLYGGDLNEEQTQQFIATFQEKERAAQTQQYHQQYGAPGEYGPGGETVSAPSGAGVGYEAEQAIRQAHPGQVFASYMGQNLQKLMPGLLGEGAGLI